MRAQRLIMLMSGFILAGAMISIFKAQAMVQTPFVRIFFFLQKGDKDNALKIAREIKKTDGIQGLEQLREDLGDHKAILVGIAQNAEFFDWLDKAVVSPRQNSPLHIKEEVVQSPSMAAKGGQVVIRNASGHDILVQKFDKDFEYLKLERPIRIGKGTEESIAASLDALKNEGAAHLFYGHSSDAYAGRTMFSLYTQEEGDLPINQIAQPMEGETVIITILPPRYEGSVIKGKYYWFEPRVTFEKQASINIPLIVNLGTDVYNIPIFRAISDAAKEYKYISHGLKTDAYTPAMLKRVDPERWSCLILGLHRPDFISSGLQLQIATLRNRFMQRLQLLNAAFQVGTIPKSLNLEAKELVREATRNLLRSLGKPEDIITTWEGALYKDSLPQATATTTSTMPSVATKEEAEECPICFEKITPAELFTTPCRHKFHKACLGKWKQKAQTCPMCRSNL